MLGPALIVGADGLIGRALCDRLAAGGGRVLRTSRRAGSGALPLDLDAPPSTWALPDEPVDVAFLCAAITGDAACARDPERSRRVNVARTVALADALLARGAFVVFPSSDLAAAPTGPYAAHKREVERLLEGRPAAVVRLGKVLAKGAGLLGEWIAALRRAETVRPLSNARFAPVALDVAVDALITAGARRAVGITGVWGAPEISYADAIAYLARKLGLDPTLIVPAESAGAPPPSARGAPAAAADVWRTLDLLYVEAERP